MLFAGLLISSEESDRPQLCSSSFLRLSRGCLLGQGLVTERRERTGFGYLAETVTNPCSLCTTGGCWSLQKRATCPTSHPRYQSSTVTAVLLHDRVADLVRGERPAAVANTLAAPLVLAPRRHACGTPFPEHFYYTIRPFRITQRLFTTRSVR